MTKPAPAVVRATQILNYLAARPTHPLSMTEIAEAVGVNPASTLAILQALTESGYLMRHPRHKTYSIGPSLLITGHAARLRYQIADLADAEVQSLATKLGTVCTLSMIAGEDIVIAAAAGRSPSGIGYPVGSRVRLAAPAGLVFMAWACDDDVRRWLEAAGLAVTDRLLTRIQRMLTGIRADGFYVAGQSARIDRYYTLAGSGVSPGQGVTQQKAAHEIFAEMVDRMCDPVELSTPCRIGFMGAPIFGGDGEVVATLSVLGLPDQLSRDEVFDIGNRLIFTADHITAVTHGARAPMGDDGRG